MKRKNHSEQAELSKPIICECITTWQEEEKSFTNKTQLVKALSEELKGLDDKQPSTSSIRRYLDEMNFIFHSSTNYDFEPNTIFLDELITYIGLSKHICFFLKEASMGTFIAEKINDYYHSSMGLGKYIHCIAIENLLICFYRKNTKKNVTLSHLKEEIPEILKNYYFNTEYKKKT